MRLFPPPQSQLDPLDNDKGSDLSTLSNFIDIGSEPGKRGPNSHSQIFVVKIVRLAMDVAKTPGNAMKYLRLLYFTPCCHRDPNLPRVYCVIMTRVMLYYVSSSTK